MGDTERGARAVRSRYDWSSTTPSIAVIDGIAAIENVEPAILADQLETTLYDNIDPEALDALVTTDSQITVTFTVDKYHVRIDGNELAIRPSRLPSKDEGR